MSLSEEEEKEEEGEEIPSSWTCQYIRTGRKIDDGAGALRSTATSIVVSSSGSSGLISGDDVSVCEWEGRLRRLVFLRRPAVLEAASSSARCKPSCELSPFS